VYDVLTGAAPIRSDLPITRPPTTPLTAILQAEDRAPKTLTKYKKVFERVLPLAKKRTVRDVAGIDMAFIDVFRKLRMEEGADW
jgi:hypothetical protein